MERGTGETTRQIKNAPPNATFVWCNCDTWYPKELAMKLGRDDIDIRTPRYIENLGNRGSRRPIVIDHATYNVGARFREGIAYAEAMDLLVK